jgi:2'-5' RNA ligase
VRLFAAIDLSSATREAMAVEQKRIASSLTRSDRPLKWVRPDRAHLTLVFLGEVGTGTAASLVSTIREDVQIAPFELVFSGLGVFPPGGAPRVLWVGVSKGAAEVTAVQREIAARVAAHGIEIEDRAFRPHLTLGRWRSSRPSDRARTLAAGDGMVAAQQVARVTLFESRLSPSGPEYTALTHANLTGA